jgi:hypothetical protein
MLNRRRAKTGQTAIIYFVSDHDPSGHDLQRAWEEALRNFNVIGSVVRIGLTMDQVQNNTDSRGQSLEGLAIQVKPTDSLGQIHRRIWPALLGMRHSPGECD